MAIESASLTITNTICNPLIVSSFDNNPSPTNNELLLEDTYNLLLENGSSILLEK